MAASSPTPPRADVDGAVDLTTDVTGVLPVSNGGVGADNTTQTYTPTLTNTTNIAASTHYLCQYMRVGNVVTVSGQVAIDPTAAGAILLGISLPIASTFSDALKCGGTAVAPVTSYAGSISADATNHRAQLDAVIPVAGDVANRLWYFQFTYLIQ